MRAALQHGTTGRSPLDLASDWLAGGVEPAPFQGDLVITESGRSAIALACRIWGLGERDQVLVPAYNCGSEISPYVAAGARLRFYRVNERAQIDVADLLRRLNDQTRVVHITHYFGWPAELGDLVPECRRRGIKILEDCALSLFSGGTGAIGDAVIFSLRKSLPCGDGGGLMLRDAGDWTRLLERASFRTSTRAALSMAKYWVRGLAGIPTMQNSTRAGSAPSVDPATGLPDLPAPYYATRAARYHRGSRFAAGALKRSNPADIVQRRRDNYAFLYRELADTKGLEVLWREPALPRGMCPLGFPILVANKLLWCDRLNAAGISVSPWWHGCHRGLDWHQFPEALRLKSQLLLLPVHQRLAAREMAYLAAVARALASGGLGAGEIVPESSRIGEPVGRPEADVAFGHR